MAAKIVNLDDFFAARRHPDDRKLNVEPFGEFVLLEIGADRYEVSVATARALATALVGAAREVEVNR